METKPKKNQFSKFSYSLQYSTLTSLHKHLSPCCSASLAIHVLQLTGITRRHRLHSVHCGSQPAGCSRLSTPASPNQTHSVNRASWCRQEGEAEAVRQRRTRRCMPRTSPRQLPAHPARVRSHAPLLPSSENSEPLWLFFHSRD